jgi:glyoxylase-like metal-dependent hydrolase (beta-lactamase superfamily II)
MESLICTTCGTEYPPDQPVPALCHICNDDRQYINENGQSWVSFNKLKSTHSIRISAVCDNLYSLKVQPDFALANRALLLLSPAGNILWDCIPLPDDKSVEFIRSIGGLKAIAFSHPHYYSNMNEWAELFDCPVYIHENDRQWIMYKGKHIQLWNRESLSLWDGIRIVHTGGHFPGSCVLHVPSLSDKGTVLSGDSLYVSRSKRHIAVMYSYPNQILLRRHEFAAFDKKTSSLEFDTIYGAFDNQDLEGNAQEIFNNSMQRYRVSYGLAATGQVHKEVYRNIDK